MMLKLPRSLVAGSLALGAFWLARAGAAPTVTFELDPPNPVAGQLVRLRDTSTAAATSWLWDFGDGTSATTASPAHAWSQPGPYTVRLVSQGSTAEAAMTVSDQATLRLLAAHPFEFSIEVKDPGNGTPSPAQAIAISDRFGWFSFPTLTHDPGNPEVTVKILEAPTFGHYWVFWSAMTSLQYTMTVRDVTTNQVQVYEKTDSSPCGSWDLESFPYVPTSTPGPATETPVPGQPTRTRTPTPQASQTPTPTLTPTITPTPGPTILTLRATSWQWDWCPSADQGFLPCRAGACPYDIDTSQHGVITLHQGCSYQLTLYNSDSGEYAPYHQLNAHPEIGLPNPTTIPMGDVLPPVTITIPASAIPDVNFSCLNTSCGNAQQHEGMLGLIHVVP
jgi:PKD repeat protein